MEDLFQVGAIGLMKAIDHFDVNLNFSFSTYAVPLIIGEMKRFLRDDGMLHVSRKIKEDARKIAAAREAFEKKENRTPTVGELTDFTGLDQETVVTALCASMEVESLSKPVGNGTEEQTMELGEHLADGQDMQERLVDEITVREMLEWLLEEEKQLISLRYLEGKTQTETARVLGMNQVSVSRKEKKILRKLRAHFSIS